MTTGLLTPTHVAILIIVVLLIFGANRLPQAGRALGLGIREFKDAIAAGGQPPRQPLDAARQASATASPSPRGLARTARATSASADQAAPFATSPMAPTTSRSAVRNARSPGARSEDNESTAHRDRWC